MQLKQPTRFFVFSCLCWMNVDQTKSLNINSDSQRKLSNEINSLLNVRTSQNDISADKTYSNDSPTLDQATSRDSISMESQYAETVRKMFENTQSNIEPQEVNENQALPQVSDDQLFIDTFSRDDSQSNLVPDEKVDFIGPKQATNISQTTLNMESIKNLTPSIVPSRVVEIISHKPSTRSRLLASISPEEFLKRLKKHLEISKSNLRILKRNFHDFLREKDQLFRLNQKIAQEHPKEIKVSIIRTDDSFQGVPLVTDAEVSQNVQSEPISQICPQDCPVSLIHIAHHHHGRSPVPCICAEGDGLNIESNVESDFETFALKSFKPQLRNSKHVKASKSSEMKISEKVKPQKMPNNLNANAGAVSPHSSESSNDLPKNEDSSGFQNIDPTIKVDDTNKIVADIKDKNVVNEKKSELVGLEPLYHNGCEESTDPIPAAVSSENICETSSCMPCCRTIPNCPSMHQCNTVTHPIECASKPTHELEESYTTCRPLKTRRLPVNSTTQTTYRTPHPAITHPIECASKPTQELEESYTTRRPLKTRRLPVNSTTQTTCRTPHPTRTRHTCSSTRKTYTSRCKCLMSDGLNGQPVHNVSRVGLEDFYK